MSLPASDQPTQSQTPQNREWRLQQRQQRHRAHVALATGLTVAALIASETLAILDRTVSAKPVQIGQPAVNSTASGPTSKKPKPSLNISDSGVQTAPQQPAPFSLSSR